MNRLRRCLNSFDAARRAAAGYLSLLVQSKGNPKKARPGAADPSCASRPGRARAELAGRKNRARLRHRLATSPGRGCDARRRLRVPTSTATPFTEKRNIVCGRVSVLCVTNQALRSNTMLYLMSAWRHSWWVTAQTACLTHPTLIFHLQPKNVCTAAFNVSRISGSSVSGVTMVMVQAALGSTPLTIS